MKTIIKAFIPVISIGLFFSCGTQENKNVLVPENGLDQRIPDFFEAVGLPLQNVDVGNTEAVQADLSRVAKLFVNEMSGEKKLNENGKLVEDQASRPFFKLTKNVGVYFTSQIWKTQLTSSNDVKFYDLAKDVNEPDNRVEYKSKMFNLKGVFLNPYADTSDPKNYLGSIINGFYGKINPQTNVFNPLSHFYIMEYKLRDANGSSTGFGVRKYYALVSIPAALESAQNTKQARLVMFSHAGDFGVSPADLVTYLNTKLSEYIVVAPLFPGEPLCTQIVVGTKGCMRFNDENKLEPDTIGHYNNPYLPKISFNSILPIDYPRSPLNEDVFAFLGAHNAISRVMSLSLDGTNPVYKETLPHQTLLLPLEHPEELINAFQDLNSDYSGAKMVPAGLAPQTIGIGASRGGGVLLASIGRIGFFMNGASLDTQFPHAVQDDDGSTFEFQYPLFNSAALFFSPTSVLTGQLRLMSIMILKNEIDAIKDIPMVTDLVNNPYFVNYRIDPNPSRTIQAVVKRNGVLSQPYDTLTQLATYIASNDMTFLAPFVASGLQNWNSYYFEDNMRAPGSIVFLHGSQDMVVPMTESTIGSTALGTVWAGLYHTPMDPFGNYLSNERFASMHPMLKGSFIPGVGVAQYTFQPSNEFFNIPCDFEMLASIQQPHTIYNTDVGRCFGGGYSPNADGQNIVSMPVYGHTDPSFFTSNLLNPIDPELLHLAALSSNIFNKNQLTYNFGFDADSQMRFGGPTYKNTKGSTECIVGVSDCSFPYTIPLQSPTFMRYMADEGKLSANIVAEKKHIFSGDFKPHLKSNVKPHDVLFAWLESVACDWCEVGNENDEPLFPSHFGVFHDFKFLDPRP